MGKFVVSQAKTGYKFDLVAGNGEVIATSQIYKSENTCLKGVDSVRRCCVGEIEDQTVEGFEKTKCPKFQVYVDRAGEFRFRLLAKNGQNICHGEGYTKLSSCLNGIESVRKNAVDAKIEMEE